MVECSAEPSVLAGVDGDADYVVQHEPDRRLQLPRAGRAATAPARLPLDQPRLPGAPRSTRSRCEEARDALRARRRAAGRRAPRATGSPRTSRSTGARTLYGATKLAAELLIEEYARRLRPARGDRPLRRDRRARGRWARSTRASSPLDARATTSAAPLAYIGFGGAGKQVRDLLHVEDLVDLVERAARATRSDWDGRDGQRRRRPRVQPLAARDDRALPRADRQRGADRRRSTRPARATSASTSPTARALFALHRLAPAAQRRARCSPTSSSGSREHEDARAGARHRRLRTRCRSRSSPAPGA